MAWNRYCRGTGHHEGSIRCEANLTKNRNNHGPARISRTCSRLLAGRCRGHTGDPRVDPTLAANLCGANGELLSGPGTAPWPQFGYGAGHTGFNPLETTITTQNVSNLQVAWNDQSIVQAGGIVVDGGVAYVDDMGQSNAGLYALDATTGAQKWYANVRLNGAWGNFTHAVSAISGSIVVTPCSNGSSTAFLTGLCGVSVTTGKIMWRRYCTEYQGNPCGGLVGGGSSPTLYDGRIFFQSTQGVNEQPDTQALNPSTGKILWDDAGVYRCPDAGESSSDPLPAGNGLVYAVLGCQGQNGATELCALSTASGAAAWCDPSQPYVQNMILAKGELYVTEQGNNDEVVLALNAKTGAQSWTASLPGANGWGSMATAGTTLYVEDGGAGVFALGTATGQTLWSQTSNANLYDGGVISVANGIVYTDGGGGNNGNYAIDAFNAATGSLIWSSSAIGNGAAEMTPVIVNGTVYAGCYTVCAFRVTA